MNVLVINCGSSSLKYQLIDSNTEEFLAKGLCERIGLDGRLVYQKAGLDKETTDAAMPTHKEAIQLVLDALTNEKTGTIKSLEEVDAVGDGAHGDWMTADEKAAEVHTVQAVEPGVEAGELPDVIADHVQQALGHVLLGELWGTEAARWAGSRAGAVRHGE